MTSVRTDSIAEPAAAPASLTRPLRVSAATTGSIASGRKRRASAAYSLLAANGAAGLDPRVALSAREWTDMRISEVACWSAT
jgi:hypothetical protein